MIKLYRAVSQQEKDDYNTHKIFQTGKNTLEAKQFFKSRIAIKQFVDSSILQDYDPPYSWLLIISIDEHWFNVANHTEMRLDGYDAISIDEDHLSDFTNYVTFVKQESL
jgi:hypothetical protein